MLKPFTFVVVLALIVCGALVNGAVTQRWNVFEPNVELTERMHSLEVRYAGWQPVEVPTEMPMNEKSSATSRRYTSANGQFAVISMISGIPGSVATHTPDVCYPSSGYKTIRAMRKESFTLPDGRECTCYVADFEKRTETNLDRVRVRWAWTEDGTWIAPDNPRWQFARQLRATTLYKLYITTPLPESEGKQTSEDEARIAAFVAAVWAQYSSAFGQ